MLSADALWAAPDNNAGPPAGLIPVYTTGLMPSAARSNQLPTQRVGTRKTPCRKGVGRGVEIEVRSRNRAWQGLTGEC
ncbi:hypothetical protein [Candidatus Thiosymbion oneisti]|uniref:hypothetical protein n=1 Tax=Candidatus Thiosymbion oneisti TaxID=589554 RepID=UPI00114D0E04|nr:hypothetical protein [Candidatus Thiosymbion oneisti]